PVTPKDLVLSTPYQGLPTELIVDGEIIEENLRQVGLDRAWLINSLTQRGITSPDQVFYASLNTQGELYTSRRASKAQSSCGNSIGPSSPAIGPADAGHLAQD